MLHGTRYCRAAVAAAPAVAGPAPEGDPVQIPHDTRRALDVVVALVNTAAEADQPDGLSDIGELRGFVQEYAISDVGELSARDLAGVRTVRGKFAQVFASPNPRAASILINELVATAGTTPQLTDHDGYDWHVHYFAPGASVGDHLAADGGMALAFIVVSGEQERRAAARPRTADGPSSTSPATAPGATATAGPAGTGCTWRRTGRGARRPTRRRQSRNRSCTAASSSRMPITARKIIRGGWESAKRQPRGSSTPGAGTGGSLCDVSNMSGR